MPLRPLLLACAALLAACSHNPATGSPMLSLSTQTEQRNIGDATAQSHLKAEGLYRPGSATAAYVTGLCNQVYAVTEAAAEAVQCNLSDDGSFNAFATPGYLFVHRGLLPFMSSEDELAAVLGHEAGHLTARHVARSLTQQRATQLILMGSAVALGAGGADPLTMQTAGNMGSTAGQLGMARFSRSHETEADAIARRYLQKAGYNPAAGVSMARNMLHYGNYAALQAAAFGAEDDSLLDRLKSSHPASPERVAAALAETGEPQSLPPLQDLSRQRYLNAINGLPWGPQRRYGIARQTELILTRQRIILPLPEGTTTHYLSSGHPRNLGTWLIAHPHSGVSIRLTSLPMQSGSNPASVIEKSLPTLRSKTERITLGGTPQPSGATLDDLALAEPDTTPEDTDATLAEDDLAPPTEVIGYTATHRFLNSPKRWRTVAFGAPTRANEMLVYTITYPSEEAMQREDANLMAVLKNVRFLTRGQALAYKPLQIHIFHAAAGDSVTRQASKLPVGAYQEELFRALNNLPTGTEMQTGQLYKTIIDLNP
ncbi:MAG: hypothetical protein EON60_04890 [Alphaproteobacteria bacterium]|nr:MAG: hypothetical protein EON60_04890 [Alphaproteobacteria bacterium]